MSRSWLGPWPLQPLWMFILIAVTQHFGITPVLLAEPTVDQSELEIVGVGLGRTAFALILAACVVGVEWSVYRLTTLRGQAQGPLAYAAMITLGALTATAAQLIALNALGRDIGSLLIGGIVLHYLLLLLILHTSIGIIGSRMSDSAARAEEALERLSTQERRFVAAEERARRIAAEFLHDRVQADLLVIAIELRRVAEQAPPEVAAQIASITEAVETVRRTDVRDTSRSLSPLVQSTGLTSALNALAQHWQPALAVHVSIDEGIGTAGDPGAEADLALGIYRIVEQALLNAAAHGRARQAQVSITRREGRIRVQIADDGSGFDSTAAITGGGFAVSEVWARLLGGTWEVESRAGSGASVTAWLPNAR